MVTVTNTIFMPIESADQGVEYLEFTTAENCCIYVFNLFGQEVSTRSILRWSRDSEIVQAISVGKTIMINPVTVADYVRIVKGWQLIN